MSPLPSDFSNGDILSANDLNLILAARNGNLEPIDPISNTEIDASFDLGTITSRWRDLNSGGELNISTMHYIRARPQVQETNGFAVLWDSPIDLIGTSISQLNSTYFTLADNGIYMISTIISNTRFGSPESRLRLHQERPVGTVIYAVDNITADAITGYGVDNNLMAIFIAQANDVIRLSVSDLDNIDEDLNPSTSDINIIRIF